MSLTEILIKIGGILLFLAGLGLILSAVGLPIISLSIYNEIVSIIVGFILMGLGIYVLRGGTPTL